jgi:hypothetical protein
MGSIILYVADIIVAEEKEDEGKKCGWERADCNETERMDKKNWNNLDQVIWRKKAACG